MLRERFTIRRSTLRSSTLFRTGYCLCSALQFNFHTFPRILNWRKLSCLDKSAASRPLKITKAAVSLLFIDWLMWNTDAFFLYFLPSTKQLVWWANVGSTQAGTCSTLQVFAELLRCTPGYRRKSQTRRSLITCLTATEQKTFLLNLVWKITEWTGEISHSSGGVFIPQPSSLDSDCNGCHQLTCTGAPRPGLNKSGAPPANALPSNITICPPSLHRELKKGGSPSSRPSFLSIVRLTVSLTPFYLHLWIFKYQHQGGKYAAGALKLC